MSTPASSRFALALLCACLGGGALMLATSQFRIARPVPAVQVPEARVPTIVTPRVPESRLFPPARRQSVQIPVMSADSVRAHLEADRRGLDYLPGRVLVKFRNGVGISGQARALAVLGGDRPLSNLEWAGDVAVVRDSSGLDPHVLASRLSQQPEVAVAQPDYLLKLHATPNDPSYVSRQWNFALINMPRAWDLAPGGQGVIVAVVDSGVTTIPPQSLTVQTWNGSAIVSFQMPVGLSPDFTSGRFVSPRDFVVSTTAPPSLVIDTDGHGTHVAGTIGEETNNGIGLAGMAYRASIMPLKACRSYWDVQFAMSAAGIPGVPTSTQTLCSTSATTAAIRFAADNGAQVLNYSLGSTSPNTLVRDAMQYAISRGVFIAMSNGNEFEDGNPTTYPASYGPGLNGAMAVGATNRVEQRAFYSSSGSWTEIAAPGGDRRQGNTVWQMSIRASDSDERFVTFPRFDQYDERDFQGTSMASPHVAGLAALLVSRGHTDPVVIEAIIKQSAKDIGSPGQDGDFGAGLIQPFRALIGQGIRR